jgi:hypothetical protein
MGKELELAIEELYRTFAKYPFKSTIDGCPCCVSDADKEKIHSKQLSELEEDDLSRYAFKAISTWGDVSDFKHYLPRIFELMSTTNFVVDSFVILGKLELGLWRTWNAHEQIAIEKFLKVWWFDIIKSKDYFDKEIFLEIYKLNDGIEDLLRHWPIDFSNNSYANFIQFVHDNYADLNGKRNTFKSLSESDVRKLLSWIDQNAKEFELGFFHFDQIDKAFAEKISNTQYIYERTK